MKQIRAAFLVDGTRTPFARSMTAYRSVSRQELMTAPLAALRERYDLGQKPLGDVALGAVLNSARNWGLARESALGAGLHPHTPAYFIQRACGTSLEATAQIAAKIALGQIEDGIAGGVDTNSDLPIEVSDELRDLLLEAQQKKSALELLSTFGRFRPRYLKPQPPTITEPRTHLSMGEHAELMAKEWKIPRKEQDALAFRSHMNAVKAYEDGFYHDLVIPLHGQAKDGQVRPDTSLERLAKLSPVFDRQNGTLTAGNSSPLTDGAAAVLLSSESAMKERGWRPLARFIDCEVAAVNFVEGEGLLMAPTIAVGRLLARNGLRLQDFDYYEIHEAFAAQVLCTLAAWKSREYCRRYLDSEPLGEIDMSKLNVVGSSIALGHPFAATGARIVATLGKLLKQRGSGRGLISICTAGGMGVAAILEAP